MWQRFHHRLKAKGITRLKAKGITRLKAKGITRLNNISSNNKFWRL